ncbi:MAG TPA: GYD domain-containing protein [Patescibacteria group bacterium]|nr:GYD domain-containing protein [Patescibacteria group bacterium]
MPKYLITGSYTAEGARGVLAEGGSGRRAAAGQLIESLGGTVEAFYFAFGSDDFFLIADLPGNAAAAAGGLTAAASGAIRTRTTVLLTPAEVDAATKLSPRYRAPGA